MKYLAVFFTLILAGCGSESESDNSVSLADIVGVWDSSKVSGQGTNEVYFIIEEDGEMRTFDYDGDSAGNGNNCYNTGEGVQLTDQGDGNFLFVNSDSDGFVAQATLSGDTLVLSKVDNGETETSVKTTRIESDFTPLCNELR